MKGIHPKVLEDLEFHAVRQLAAAHTFTKEAAGLLLNVLPQTDQSKIIEELRLTDEWLRSIQTQNPLPLDEFDAYSEALDKIEIDNYFLEPRTLLSIAHTMELLDALRKFLKKFKTEFPLLNDHFQSLTIHKDIEPAIRKIVGRDGEIKDKASPALAEIRTQIKELKQKRLKIFQRIKQKAAKAGWLDEIGESVSGDRPVLALKAAYRRKIKGFFAGSSRSGNIVFIEPEESLSVTEEIQAAQVEEQSEIIRILKEITVFLRPYKEDLLQYENYLIHMDTVRAKAILANETNAVVPKISSEIKLHLKEAYHPLLLLENRKKNLPVTPQNFGLDKNRRIMVISGPNAGGKSITLKTAGLLQLMLQAGFPVPVHPESEMPFFEKILTDIGDNQSIENQLSTYSYRLKNMRLFLRLADEKTLFLIDEFGTGSDPELGGALAEVFLEEFQKSGALGIITTHYNNLKLAAEKLPAVFNAHMEFNLKTMSPTYRLQTGQPGSSYTFEVAAKMGIPWSIINRAKKKTDRKKVKFDQTLAEMHQRQNQLRKAIQETENQKREWIKLQENLKEKEFELLKKLEAFRQLYEDEKQYGEAGKRILSIFNEYVRDRDKKKLWHKINKWLDKEIIKEKPVRTKETKKIKRLREEIQQTLKEENIREQLEEMEIRRMPYVPKPGDRVRVAGSSATAILEAVDGNKAVLNYGKFKASVPLKDLETVVKK